jgi:hypothetical protein
LIGGLLLFIGSSFLYEWVVEGKDRLPRSEYAVVLLIVVTVASQGYIAGVAAGVLGAAAVFVSDYSKVPVVRSRLRLGQRGGVRSSAPRMRKEVEVIAYRGSSTYGAKLQGFLFFATAYKVLEEIRAAHDESVAAYEEKKYAGDAFSDEDLQRTPKGLSHVVLDFASVVGVDGSAIAVFEKLERWARRENVVLVLSDCARPELSRVLDIALAGEAKPTFAFVDRPNAGKDSLLAPNLQGLREAVGDGLMASDAFGIVVQTTDLDAALRFTEQSLLFLESDFVARFAKDEDEETRLNGSRSIGDWTDRDGRDDENDENGFYEDAFGAFTTFDAVCESVCETRDEERAFREAWTPVVFEADAVVCERGEVADRIYWIESAVVVVETGGRVTEDTEGGASDESFASQSQRSGDVSNSVDEYDDEVPETSLETSSAEKEESPEESPAPRAAAAAAAVTAAAAAVADLRDRLVGASADETETASSSSSGDEDGFFSRETEEGETEVERSVSSENAAAPDGGGDGQRRARVVRHLCDARFHGRRRFLSARRRREGSVRAHRGAGTRGRVLPERGRVGTVGRVAPAAGGAAAQAPRGDARQPGGEQEQTHHAVHQVMNGEVPSDRSRY